MEKHKTVGIGEVSKQTQVSQRQLRFWEEQSYIQPERVVCGDRAYRQYSSGDIRLIGTIKQYLDEGYQLKAAVEKAKATMEKKI